MSDFTSGFWSPYIAAVTVVSILACALLLWKLSSRKLSEGEQAGTTGHVWDDDLTELNNPLPNWWRWLFYITIVFSLVYLAMYPGLGSFAGLFNWSSKSQYEDERSAAQQRFGPLFDAYLARDIKTVATDPRAHEMGNRLFLTYCAQCHGSDAGGSKGFPNLRDGDWLYGGEPDAIKTSIATGRFGLMPPMGPALGPDGVKQVAHYVLSLSGSKHDAALAGQGKTKFVVCAACHGAEGKGNTQLGAPNLTDQIWLYGGDEATIIETITSGRSHSMPAHGEFLGEGKVHVLAAYIYGLSHLGQK
jgi:cytochrome c oxidase cbb3-type subunit III